MSKATVGLSNRLSTWFVLSVDSLYDTGYLWEKVWVDDYTRRVSSNSEGQNETVDTEAEAFGLKLQLSNPALTKYKKLQNFLNWVPLLLNMKFGMELWWRRDAFIGDRICVVTFFQQSREGGGSLHFVEQQQQ